MSAKNVNQILNSAEFKALVRKKLLVTTIFTLIMLSVYFGFILLLAFNKEFLSQKVSEYLTIGLIFGVGLIVFAWLLTGIYIHWANTSYDKSVQELRNQILNQ